MLSLNTTKAVSDLVKFQNDKDMVLMCKMDGLTISLRYLIGELVSAEMVKLEKMFYTMVKHLKMFL